MRVVQLIRTNISLQLVATHTDLDVLANPREKGSSMKRVILLLAALLFLPWGAIGCRTCQSDLDYCGPLPDEPCDFMYRRNSILGGDPQSTANLEAAPSEDDEENLPTPVPQAQDGELPEEAAPMPMPPEDGVQRHVEPDSSSAQQSPRPRR